MLIQKLNVLKVFCVLLCLLLQVLHSMGFMNPVIFIPGDGGNRLEAKLNMRKSVNFLCWERSSWFDLWMNVNLFALLYRECWVDYVKLKYDNMTRTTKNTDGVEIRVPGFGTTEPVEWLSDSPLISAGSYFADIADALEELGYERDIDMKGAPYDFRKGPNENYEYFSKLKLLIENTYETNEERVVLIAHSMGASMALVFLQNQSQDWKDTYIESLVSLAGAYGGSVMSLKAYVMGFDMGSSLLDAEILRDVQITTPSTAWLLPSKHVWKSDEVLVQTPYKSYSLNNLRNFFYDIHLPYVPEMMKDLEPFTSNFSPPGVEVHCLYGKNIKTVERLQYEPDDTDLLEDEPTLVYGNGDGTINLKSLASCKLWKGKQLEKIYVRTFNRVEHIEILHDDHVIDYIVNLLSRL